MTKTEVVLCNPVRTAIGSYGGSLKSIPAPKLGATAIAEVLRRSGVAPGLTRDFVSRPVWAFFFSRES